jgi:hypothetical protein
MGRGLREFKDAIAGAGRADDPDEIVAGGDAARSRAEPSAAA